MNIRLTPKIGFVISDYNDISTYNRKTLDMLYQPILGSTAYSLINLMWRINQNSDKKQYPHFEILSLLKIDIKAFYKARLKLEGAGLLRVLYKETESQPLYIYQLIAPLSAKNFFDNDLLSVALLEIIGPDLYQRLKGQLLPKVHSFKDAHDITKNFLEVYQINSKNIDYKDHSQVEKNNDDNINKVQSNQNDFDFELLYDLLNKTYSDITQVKKYNKLISSEHRLYGIDEIKMSELIQRSTNVINNNFKPEHFKMLISNLFQKDDKIKNANQENNSQSDNSNQNNFNDEEKSLFHSARVYPPIQFLDNLKNGLGSFITRNDEMAVRDVMKRSGFTNEILNMLTYHILVDLNKSSLSTNLIETIASQWKKDNVNNAEDAYLEIHNYNQKRENQKNNKNKYSGQSNRKHIKEKIPDWAKKDYNPNYKKIDSKRKKELQEKLKRIDKN